MAKNSQDERTEFVQRPQRGDDGGGEFFAAAFFVVTVNGAYVAIFSGGQQVARSPPHGYSRS